MTDAEIKMNYTTVTRLLAESRLGEALQTIASNARQHGVPDVADRADRLAESYGYMLNYFEDGVDDPHRALLHDDMLADARRLADELHRTLMTPEGTALYYNVLRMERLHGMRPIADLVADAADERSGALENLFNAVWTRFPLNQADTDALASAISDDILPEYAAVATVEAIGLGLLDFYDPARFDLLMRAASSDNVKLAAPATVAVVTALFRFRHRRHPRGVLDRLAILSDNPRWASRVDSVFIEYVRAAGTKRLGERMQRDVFPDMVRLSSEMQKRMSERKDEAETDPEKTLGELGELIENEGFAKRMKEINEMQLQGDDVYMSTFTHLKRFSFFTEAAHWFVPFDPKVVAASADEMVEKIGTTLGAVPFLCDSDKYSIFCSVAEMSPQQRQMAMGQFSPLLNAEVRESMGDAEEETFARAVNRVIKNHYRFYNLFRRKGDFFNPFAYTVNPLSIYSLSGLVDIRALAAYMMTQGLYRDSLMLFKTVDDSSHPEAATCRMMGYCEEMLGNADEAIELYTRADLLEADNRWTLRRLSRLLTGPEHFETAIEVDERLLAMMPDDVDTLVAYGRALMFAGRYDDALLQLYTAEHLAKNPAEKVWRLLGWTMMLSGDSEGAHSYYLRAIAESTRPDDYLQLAVIDINRHNLREAVNDYITVRDRVSIDDFVSYVTKVGARFPALRKLTTDDLALLADTIRRRLMNI